MLQNRFLVVALLTASGLPGQNGPYMRDWRPPSGEAASKPRLDCPALRSLTGYEFTIISAERETAGNKEFCRVMGQVQPEIRFEVSLPSQWNRRLYMFGNGGYAGENLESPGRKAQRDAGLRLGFSVAQTNTGHDAAIEPLGSFAVNSQKLYDYAFRAVHVTAETAKRLAAAYYGSTPARSYFFGCSTGGRQALISAQRFPDDFDGIVAGAPVLDFTGTMLGYTQSVHALAAAAIPASKIKTLAAKVYASCDEKDGVKDGLIEDPRRCGFSPARELPKCAAGGDSDICFTAGQMETLEKIYADVTVDGKRLFPGWPVGAEIAGANGRSGWDPWLIRESDPPISVVFAETFFRFFAFPKKDPNLTLKQVNLARDAPLLSWIRQVLDATDPDLSRFRARGGKLLMYFGWADPALNPRMGVEYYESVMQKMGPATREFFRLYMLPGVFHCAGGPGCAAFDPMAALIPWVEQGKAPETLVAAQVEAGKTVRTRPLCPYPQAAKYNGSGSIDDAASFRCETAGGVAVSPAWLSANRQHVIVLEASWAKTEDAKDYLAGHIPGAAHVNTDDFETGYPRWRLRPPEQLHATIGKLGIGPDATVVVYGRKTTAAARVWWILHFAGVRDVRFLDGGYSAWIRAGYASEVSVKTPPPVVFSAPLRESAIASTEAVAAIDRDRTLLADNRSRAEFDGKISGYSYLESKGRIPGAIHIEDGADSAGVYQNPADGSLRPIEEIRELWRRRGLPLDDGKEIVFYCGSGWRSSLAFLYATAMGLRRVRNYSDGWSGWSTDYTEDPKHHGITPGWRQSPSANPIVSSSKSVAQ
jgi:feruloyl esterase